MFPKIKMAPRNIELELIYEMIKDNSKLSGSYTLTAFIDVLKTKVKTASFEELSQFPSAKCIANIFFVMFYFIKTVGNPKV